MSLKQWRGSIVVAALAAAAAAARLLAAPPAPEAVGNPQITAAEIREHVRYLASPELEGRGSGTAGNDLAADYLAGRFEAARLKPAGEGGTYFQKFPVITGVALGPGNRLTLAQGKQVRTLTPAQASLKSDTARLSDPRPPRIGDAARVPDPRGRRRGDTPRPGSPPGPEPAGDYMPLAYSKNGVVSAPLVFAGYGISKPELGYDDYKGLDVRGKVVVVLRRTPDGDLNGKFGPYALLTYKTMTAREKGAAGILLVTGPLSDRNENLGVFALESASADAGILAAIVKRAAIEKLLAPTGKTLRDLQVMIAHGQTQSFAIPNARVDLRVNVVRKTAQTRNVIGLLEGSDPKLKHEVVVVGAHYDHLGMGGSHSLQASSEPAIHYGADDNASGTAGLLELAHYFAAHREKPGRSLLFMGFSGEEMGLLGSRHWTQQPTIPLERVAAMINLDMIGRMRNDTVSVIGASSSPVWKEVLEQANRTHGLKLQTGGSLGAGLGASDQQSFYVKQIPVLFFYTGVHPDYHRPSDTWDKVQVEPQAKLLRLVADTIERASRLEKRPAFTPDRENRPATAGSGFPVYLGTLPDYAAEVEGVALQGVREDSPAAKAGIRAGDVLVEFDGRKIRNVQEYTTVLSDAKPNVPVKVVVLRGGERVTLTVTPAARRQ